MGYNTTFLVINDALDIIRKNPEEFTEKVYMACLGHETKSLSVGNHGNPVQVMATAHADVHRLYSSHGNLLIELSPYSRETEEMYKTRAPHMREEIQKRIKIAEDGLRILKRTLAKIDSERTL